MFLDVNGSIPDLAVHITKVSFGKTINALPPMCSSVCD